MVKSEKKPIIGIPLGDPNGIGPEIALKAMPAMVGAEFTPLLIGDGWLAEKARHLIRSDFQTPLRTVTLPEPGRRPDLKPGCLNLLDVPFNG